MKEKLIALMVVAFRLIRLDAVTEGWLLNCGGSILFDGTQQFVGTVNVAACVAIVDHIGIISGDGAAATALAAVGVVGATAIAIILLFFAAATATSTAAAAATVSATTVQFFQVTGQCNEFAGQCIRLCLCMLAHPIIIFNRFM